MKKILATLILATSTTWFSGVAFTSEPAKAAQAEKPADKAQAAEATTAESAAAPPTKADIMARGAQIVGGVCVACHGLDGMSVVSANPNIAGMPPQYIAKQLEHFKGGIRKNAIMAGMSANLTPDDMKAVGEYYWMQSPKNNAQARDKVMAERGQQIYRGGIADAKVPACAGCHGAVGAGLPAIYPRLAGQWPEYTIAQLKAYQSGERKHPMMNAITSRVKDSDLAAVAEYIAGMRTAK